ncbi:SseB protein N-terminal domain-containing protein [Maribacter orientalis]|uniref:SseB protein N-terminal domain-containing protein n=2 Tax=Maribacter orientalis TaxID=228957 RepID=A0A1H7XK56_9FLAO|nr:SseB protein N-terminal domain-containing protein [Maribacter orientalis]
MPMGILDKLFGSKKKESRIENETPDNNRLIGLLENYGKDPSQENYGKAFEELVDGNSLLILPSINDGNPKDNWETLKKDSTLKLTSVFEQDGLKILGAFTSPEKLVEWSKKETEYTAMKAKDAIDFCQAHGIDRIVIDTDSSTMFVLERNKENVTTETIQEETQVQVGTPINPIAGEHLKKFQQNFEKVNTIKEVYLYAMLRNNESILVLGFVLDTYTDNSRTACIHSIQNSMEGETLDSPLEMFMLDNEDWYKTVKAIENSLIYRR